MATAQATIESGPGLSFREAARRPNVRTLAMSRAAAKLGTTTLSYGAIVSLAHTGAQQWQVSLVASSTYLSAVLFGLQGGMMADALTKRLAIVGGYVTLTLACFLVPIYFGTDVPELMVVMFLASAMMQIISPSLKAAVALVASAGELATVAAIVSMAGSIGSALGSSLLAPVLIKQTSMSTLMMVCGVVFFLAAIRTARLPDNEEGTGIIKAIGAVDWKPIALSRTKTAEWLWDNREVGVVILVGAVVVALYESLNTLIPVYVRDVLHSDPTNAIYIFAPAGFGFLLGTLMAPLAMRVIGTRKLAVIGAFLLSLSLMAFAAVNELAPHIATMNPLRHVAGWLGLSISDLILTASLIAVPANFGSTVASAAVQTYINAGVPVVRQGAAFGIQEVQENALTLAVVLMLGGIASLIGPRVIFLVAPLLTFLLVAYLIRFSFRRAGNQETTMREAMSELVTGALDEPSVQ